MALTNSNGHNDRVSVPNTTMPLRERIKRLTEKGINICWKSLPEVKSSGLLGTLTDNQVALEERKFCLITCEIVYNTELVEMIGLCKQSVSSADHLPKFNRRTALTAIEKVKCCSDLFLDAFEKHWNMTPTVSLAVLNKILQDLAPEFQHYITYCTHQEDLSTVLRTAMTSRRQVVAASFNKRLNLECVTLPLQHLRLCCFLLTDIRSMLISTANHLDSFHCNRIVADVTKLFGECYKLLVKLHGSQYIANIDRLLDKIVHNFKRESTENTISKQQKSVSVDPEIGCRKEATDSVCETDCMTSEVCTLPDVKKHRPPSVKEQCQFFDPQVAEKNFRDVVKHGDKRSTLKRQEYVQMGRRKAVDITSKQKCGQFVRKRCAIFEGEEPHNLCKRQNCCTNSSHSASRFTNNISNTTVTGRRRSSLSKYETANRSLGKNGTGSEKRIGCFKNEQNISVDNNKIPSSIICSSSSSSGDGGGSSNSDRSRSSSSSSSSNISISSSSSSNNINNDQNNKPPKSTRRIVTGFYDFSLSKSSRNSEKSEIESFHESGEVEVHEVSNKLQSSIVQNQTIPSSVLQSNSCQEELEKCDEASQLSSRLTTPTSTVSHPFQVEYKTIKTHSVDDNFDADGLQAESGSCIYTVKIEVQCSSPNEEHKPSECGSSFSNQHCNSDSPSGDSLSSVTKEISHTEELSIDIGNIEYSPEYEQQIVVSSCDPHFISTAHLPSQEENVETDESRNDYKPMNASFRRNCYQFKPVTRSEILNKNASGADDCENEYEDLLPCYTNNISTDKSNSSALSTCDVPVYQLYDFERSGSDQHQFKPVTPSEIYNKNASGADDCENKYEDLLPCYINDIRSSKCNSSMFSACDVPLYQLYDFERVKHSSTKAEESIYVEADEHVYEEINFHTKLQPEIDEQEDTVPELEISLPFGNNRQLRWVDVAEVANSGLLDEMDAEQIALQETKYEIISSESSYYKSLLILETVFVMSNELTDTAVLQTEDHATLFTGVMKAKQCSEKFLSTLLDGWPEDLKLNYLCHAVSKFVSSGSLQVCVDCCSSQISVEKTLQHLMLTNSEFLNAMSKLQADPVCEMFSLQSFLILPMQRVTRLPMLVQAILKRLPSDHMEHSVWTDTHVQLKKIAEECNEAVRKVEEVGAESDDGHVLQPDIKKNSLTLNRLPQGRTKKPTSAWKLFSLGRRKEE